MFFHNFFFFILIKSDKHVDTTDLFNKWFVLGLRNLNPFNKHVGLVLTLIAKYSRVYTIQTQYANTNYQFKPNTQTQFIIPSVNAHIAQSQDHLTWSHLIGPSLMSSIIAFVQDLFSGWEPSMIIMSLISMTHPLYGHFGKAILH